MDDRGIIIPKLILIVILTMINAFFASAEMAMVSCNKNRIQEWAEEGNRKAKNLLMITTDQTRFLSTIQVGITLAGFFSSGSAATSISKVFGHWLIDHGVAYGSALSFILITIALSYVNLVFGELVPKRIALQNAEAVALKAAPFIRTVSKVAYPFVKFLSLSTIIVLKMLGKYSEDVEEKISEEELKSYIKVSQEQGVINPAGEEMIVNIMDFDDKLAYEIMTPRTSIYMLDYDEFDSDKIPEILRRGFSRMPVYRENTDNILGTIYIKDLFVEYQKNNYETVHIDNCIKPPYFVPETKKIDMLLKELQASKNYVAILIDEYGGFSGMVTVEDIVEEIVGEIEDEYDTGLPSVEKIGPGEYIVDGTMDLDDVNDELDIKLFSENHETLSGYVIEKLGFIPEDHDKRGLSVRSDGCLLTELDVQDKRITKVRIKILPEEPEEEEERKSHNPFRNKDQSNES